MFDCNQRVEHKTHEVAAQYKNVFHLHGRLFSHGLSVAPRQCLIAFVVSSDRSGRLLDTTTDYGTGRS